MSAYYSYSDLHDALARLPLEKGDVVFTHSNLGFFGRPGGIAGSAQLCEMFFDAIMEAVGEKGTLVVPTFTYSFPHKQVFAPLGSPSAMGVFAEWVRCHRDSIRSEDPCYSVAAVGGNAATLVGNAPPNSFGDDSFFDRFYLTGGKILNMNFDAGSTLIHYAERKLGVSYRFDKTFSGMILKDGVMHPTYSIIWVRYLSDDALEFDSKPFNKLAREKDMFHVESLGRGQIGLISAEDTCNLISDTLPKRPWFLAKAESMGILQPKIIVE